MKFEFEIGRTKENTNNKTLKVVITTGVNEGYTGKNLVQDPLKKIVELWQQLALNEYATSGIYISAVATESKTIYNTAWGCPKDGEDTIVLTSIMNLEFISDREKWKQSVINIVTELKKILNQQTITIEFVKVDFIYMHQ